ncbi:hypothetical protein GCM10009720_25070 [Yaniella flava]|uniref:DUF6318 domain-containing protein n=2 Tax=Yaniella flava TaxID=287930 RepID=A0ABP5GC74_9MICC
MSPLMKKSVRNRLVTGLVGLTLAVGLTGCSNDDEETLGDTIDASDTESLEYVPASADGPAQNVPEPNLPAVATENSEEGAEATLEYFWETEEYARLTGDTEPLALVSSEDCEFCFESIQGWEHSYGEGEWVVLQGELQIEITEVQLGDDEERSQPVAHVFFELDEPGIDFYENDGILHQDSFDKPDIKKWVSLLYFDATGQRWEVEWLGLEESVTWVE